VLTEATQGNEDILKDPEPYVLFMNYGDSSLDFELRAWTSEFDKFLRVRSDVMLALTAALAENGIEIPFPQRDLHVKTLPAQIPTSKEDETS
jgi:potassium efflux system protein